MTVCSKVGDSVSSKRKWESQGAAKRSFKVITSGPKKKETIITLIYIGVDMFSWSLLIAFAILDTRVLGLGCSFAEGIRFHERTISSNFY